MLLNVITICVVCWFSVNALTGTHVCKWPITFEPVCCAHYVEDNNKCIECPNGTTSENGRVCSLCDKSFYGWHCLKECKCRDNEECHHEHGCIPIVTTDMAATEKIHISKDEGSEDNRGLNSMTAMSITIAVFALLLVMIYVLTKCASIIAKNKNVIHAIVKRNKVEPYERKANIYGAYNKTKISAEDDEYEFDSDSFEEEPYAVIRDSQVFSTLVVTDELGDICRPYDKCLQYDTKGYNHLNIMGTRHTPGSQKPFVSNHSDAVVGKKLFTFDE